MLSVFITPWMKPTCIQRAMSAAWLSARSQAAKVRIRVALQLRVMALDHVIGQTAHLVQLTAGGELLEGADTDVARSNPRQNRARQRALAIRRARPSSLRQARVSSGYRARASPHRSDIPEAPARVLPGRRRRVKREYAPSL